MLSQLTISGQTWLWTGVHSLAKDLLIPNFTVLKSVMEIWKSLLSPLQPFQLETLQGARLRPGEAEIMTQARLWALRRSQHSAGQWGVHGCSH